MEALVALAPWVKQAGGGKYKRERDSESAGGKTGGVESGWLRVESSSLKEGVPQGGGASRAPAFPLIANHPAPAPFKTSAYPSATSPPPRFVSSKHCTMRTDFLGSVS